MSRKHRHGKSNLDDIELQARVCELFLGGKNIDEIVKILENDGIFLSRSRPYEILREAADNKRFRYAPAPSIRFMEALVERFPRLDTRLDVVHSIEADHIAGRAAEKLLQIISESQSGSGPKTEFHIGFAGGRLLELTASLLSDKLREVPTRLPRTLYFHSLVARFDDDPVMDPNSFVRHFILGPPLPLEVRFVGLMAPGFVNTETVEQLRKIEGIREAFEKVKDLDLLVTSAGGHWTSGCSRLHQLYELSHQEDLLNELNAKHCVGDLMWCPVGKDGPIELRHGKRAMTLVDLVDLPTLIGQGKRVMLVLGPCNTCHEPKSEILRSLLKMRQLLISNLVVDSFTARRVLAELEEEAATTTA